MKFYTVKDEIIKNKEKQKKKKKNQQEPCGIRLEMESLV